MSITISLPSEMEQKLREKAARAGQTLEAYLEQLAADSAGGSATDLSPEEWAAQFHAWVASHQPLAGLADDSRDSIYEGRGE